MSNSYSIYDVEDCDIDAIANLAEKNDLLLEGLTPLMFSKMLRWLHSSSEIGRRVQILACSAEGVIAHYGGVPFTMKWHEKKIPTVLASNLVIDKQHRRQSPFFSLQKQFLESYQEKGYGFAYGVITREGVLNPHLRMGWKSLGVLGVYVRPVSLSSIFRKMVNKSLISNLFKLPLILIQKIWDAIFFSPNSGLDVIEVNSFDDSMSTMLNDWMEKKAICSERSIKSLNWRYFGFGERNYQVFVAYRNLRPVGYMVTRLMPMKSFLSLAIVDLVVANDDKGVFRALLRKCILLSQAGKADLIATALTDHDLLKNFFYQAGFFRSFEKFTVVGHFPKNGDIKYADFHFSDFHVNWFDHDYV